MNVRALRWASIAASLVVASRADAYCRSRTVRDVACDTFDASGCPTCGVPLFWRSRCVGFSLQQDASKQVAYDAAERAVVRGFARWSAAPCPGGTASIDARDLGPVLCSAVAYSTRAPNQNTIVFRDGTWRPDGATSNPGGLRGETIALTTTSYNTRTGELVGADMEINTAQFSFSAAGDPAPDAFDLEAVVTHEAGHFLGLAHTGDRSAVMYAGGETGRTLQRELKTDDVDAICEAYPSDGSRTVDVGVAPSGQLAATACDPEPANGLATECTANASPSCRFAPARHVGHMHATLTVIVLALFRKRRNRATMRA